MSEVLTQLEALRQAGDELEDRLEGVTPTKEKAAA